MYVILERLHTSDCCRYYLVIEAKVLYKSKEHDIIIKAVMSMAAYESGSI